MLHGIKYMENAPQITQTNSTIDIGVEGVIDKIKEIFKGKSKEIPKKQLNQYEMLDYLLKHSNKDLVSRAVQDCTKGVRSGKKGTYKHIVLVLIKLFTIVEKELIRCDKDGHLLTIFKESPKLGLQIPPIKEICSLASSINIKIDFDDLEYPLTFTTNSFFRDIDSENYAPSLKSLGYSSIEDVKDDLFTTPDILKFGHLIEDTLNYDQLYENNYITSDDPKNSELESINSERIQFIEGCEHAAYSLNYQESYLSEYQWNIIEEIYNTVKNQEQSTSGIETFCNKVEEVVPEEKHINSVTYKDVANFDLVNLHETSGKMSPVNFETFSFYVDKSKQIAMEYLKETHQTNNICSDVLSYIKIPYTYTKENLNLFVSGYTDCHKSLYEDIKFFLANPKTNTNILSEQGITIFAKLFKDSELLSSLSDLHYTEIEDISLYQSHISNIYNSKEYSALQDTNYLEKLQVLSAEGNETATKLISLINTYTDTFERMYSVQKYILDVIPYYQEYKDTDCLYDVNYNEYLSLTKKNK